MPEPITEFDHYFDAVSDQLAGLIKHMEQRFEAIDLHFEILELRLRSMDNRLARYVDTAEGLLQQFTAFNRWAEQSAKANAEAIAELVARQEDLTARVMKLERPLPPQ